MLILSLVIDTRSPFKASCKTAEPLEKPKLAAPVGDDALNPCPGRYDMVRCFERQERRNVEALIMAVIICYS